MSEADRGLSVGVISLGCPKNLVDTEVMLGLLRQAGFALANEIANFKFCVVGCIESKNFILSHF